jgi:predicted nicotinamide N-methyase
MPANPLLERLDPAAEAAMRDRIGGAVLTQAIYTIAKLGVPDRLALGARSASELAQSLDVNADALRRVLRYLVMHGVVVEENDGRFSLTAAGEYLQTAHPRSLRPSAIRAGEGLWRTAATLSEVVRTGATQHESPFFERMRGKEAEFAARMSGSTAGLADAIAAHEAVVNAKTIVDAGGGNGSLLMQILERRPELRGIVYDSEAMIAIARDVVAKSSVAERCELVSGDFFEHVPRADVVLLSWVLHDWNDERALKIIRNCRATGAATLLIVEALLPERAVATAPTVIITDPFTLDMQMLLLTGGRERTLDEYRALLREGGYEVTNATPLSSLRGASLLAAVRETYE